MSPNATLADAAPAAQTAEALGVRSVWFGETKHDPLLSVALAAHETDVVRVGTGVSIAFARSPMTLAVAANDLQVISRGRFNLGLGSQVKPHITRRFSMPWSHPAGRMREFVLAMRAIWASWQDGADLDFRGDFYTHTLMTPFFDPGPSEWGAPKVYLAGVGERMIEVAGEVGDGFLAHGFTTARHLREVALPALARGRAAAGQDLSDFEVSGVPFLVSGRDEDEFAASRRAAREQIAFYASTPAYRGVLELHGWGEMQTDLTLLSKQGRWAEMAELIDDEVLEQFAVVAEPSQLAACMRARFEDVLTAVRISRQPWMDDEMLSSVINDFEE